MKHVLEIDNRKPEDATYPTFKPADFGGDKLLFVDVGQHLVDYDGDIIIATTSNKQWENSKDFVGSLNAPYIRAKYLGCRDDFLQCTNQIRLATATEIKAAKKYQPSMGAKITNTGQVALL